ncbi:lysophospholipid acyltransferase 7-like [Pollicipes pollicipes]|uniref:lysophospholipid acyltransferase 7-like n=1 Tax=Pollicipes pollicipes TaxID=41117 RepID=UPI0018857E74|nr:lysophospholipid acyltransferase 7-like [Pollicipes pollicipes]
MAEMRAQLAVTEVVPSAGDIFHYTFSYLTVGCHYVSYLTYRDAVRGTFWQHVACVRAALWRARLMPLLATAWLVLRTLWPYKTLHLTGPFWPQLLRMHIEAGQFFLIVSVALLGQEAPCDFEAVRTVRVRTFWRAVTLSATARCWNMQVQHWLHWAVYRRAGGPRWGRVALTMLVSALWHGLWPGFLHQAIIPPLALASTVYSAVAWLLGVSLIHYTMVAALLQRGGKVMAFWGSLHFAGHVALGVLLCGGLLLPPDVNRAQPDAPSRREPSAAGRPQPT